MACLALGVSRKGWRTTPDETTALGLLLAGGLLTPLGLRNLLVFGAVRSQLARGKRAVAVPWLGFWVASARCHPPPSSGHADAANVTK